MTITQSFAFVDRQAALGRVNLALRRMRAADDEAVSLRDELAVARDDLAAGRAAFGEHHLTLAVRADSPRRSTTAWPRRRRRWPISASSRCARTSGWNRRSGRSFPATRATSRGAALIAQPATSPASPRSHNFPLGPAGGQSLGRGGDACSRRPPPGLISSISTRAISAISPSSARRARARRWCSISCSPRRCGSSRASSFSTRIAARRLFIRAIGGRYDVLRPGEPQRPQSAAARRHPGQPPLPDRLGRRRRFGAAASRSRRRRRPQIEEAVDGQFRRAGAAFAACAPSPNCFAAPSARAAATSMPGCAPGSGEGEHAWLFDNAEDLVDSTARIVGFDMTRLLDDPVDAHPGDDVSVPPGRGAAGRHAGDHRRRRRLEGAR